METNTHSKKVQKHIEDLEYAFQNYSLVEIELKDYAVIYAQGYTFYEQFYKDKDYTHIDLFRDDFLIAKIFVRSIKNVSNGAINLFDIEEVS